LNEAIPFIIPLYSPAFKTILLADVQIFQLDAFLIALH